MIYRIPLDDIEKTKTIAHLLANFLPKIGAINFNGQMGAGKTTFISCIIQFLFHKNRLPPPIVNSPTFSFIHEYLVADYKIAHFDLFRVQNASDVLNLGLYDYLDTALCLIEWAENAIDYIDKPILECNFTFESHRRILTLSPYKGYSLYEENFSDYQI